MGVEYVIRTNSDDTVWGEFHGRDSGICTTTSIQTQMEVDMQLYLSGELQIDLCSFIFVMLLVWRLPACRV